MNVFLSKYADLHVHTNYSDGTFSPAEVVTLAKKCGLSCISITDHDSVDAFFNFIPEDLEVLPGIELTSELDDSEIHILGYLINYRESWFQDKLKSLRRIRIERMKEMCKRLDVLGMHLDVGEVLSFAGCGCIGRLHLARLMVKKGFVANTQMAFNKYIGDSCPAYVSGFKLSPSEAIEIILSLKGIPVLAHPYSLNNQDIIPDLAKCGLMGLEAIYSEHSPGQISHYKDLAKTHKLLITGGSDCHGEAKPEVKLGLVKVPYELVQALKDSRFTKFGEKWL